ncbi:MAG: glycosyltransferase, partial [Steroidobacterales bacterium]
IPTFITLRGLEHDRIREAGVRRTLIDALRAATGCVAVSETLKSLAVDQGVDGARVAVIPNAIDGATFHCGDMAAARARLNLPANGGLIVSVGRLIAAKRHHELIDALAELRRRVPDATLAIIGGQSFEPHYPQQLRRQVHSLGLTEAVRFVGTIPQSAVADWLQAADAFALLSEREGCCNAVLEALATGLPVVATPVGDNAAFVRPTVNGDLVAVGDVGAATRALEHVIRRRDWDRRLISAELTAQVGSWQTVAGRVLQFFEQRLRAGMPSLSPASASA